MKRISPCHVTHAAGNCATPQAQEQKRGACFWGASGSQGTYDVYRFLPIFLVDSLRFNPRISVRYTWPTWESIRFASVHFRIGQKTIIANLLHRETQKTR